MTKNQALNNINFTLPLEYLEPEDFNTDYFVDKVRDIIKEAIEAGYEAGYDECYEKCYDKLIDNIKDIEYECKEQIRALDELRGDY